MQYTLTHLPTYLLLSCLWLLVEDFLYNFSAFAWMETPDCELDSRAGVEVGKCDGCLCMCFYTRKSHLENMNWTIVKALLQRVRIVLPTLLCLHYSSYKENNNPVNHVIVILFISKLYNLTIQSQIIFKLLLRPDV